MVVLNARVVNSCKRLLAEFFGQNLNSPRSRVARVPKALHETFHVKLAFAAKPAVVNGIFVKAPGRDKRSVVQFDAHDPFQGESLHLFVRNVQLDQMP